MPYATNGETRIFYTDTGGSGRPTVVCAHGFFMDQSMFDPQARFLTEHGYRVLAWDARGHGRTDASPDAQFSYWDLADDALRVMDTAGARSAALVGMSQGGYINLRVALRAPERVERLVLLDTEAGASNDEEQASYHSLFDAWCNPQVPLTPLMDGLAPRLIGGSNADQAPWRAKWELSDRTAIRHAADCLITRESVLDRLPEIACPAIVIRGQFDESSTADKSRALADGLPGAGTVVTIESAGHACNWTHPHRVDPVIAEFLNTPAGSEGH